MRPRTVRKGLTEEVSTSSLVAITVQGKTAKPVGSVDLVDEGTRQRRRMVKVMRPPCRLCSVRCMLSGLPIVYVCASCYN